MNNQTYRIIVKQFPTEQSRIHNNSISTWQSGLGQFSGVIIAKKIQEYFNVIAVQAVDVCYKNDPIYGSDSKWCRFNFVDVRLNNNINSITDPRVMSLIQENANVRIPISNTEYWIAELFDRTINILRGSNNSWTYYFDNDYQESEESKEEREYYRDAYSQYVDLNM